MTKKLPVSCANHSTAQLIEN